MAPNKHMIKLKSERRNYLIGSRKMAGVQPMSAENIDQTLKMLGIDVVRRIDAVQTLGSGEDNSIVVASIEPDRAELLMRTLPAQLLLTEDKPLDYAETLATPELRTFSSMANLIVRKFQFQILGEGDKPLSDVTVQLAFDAFPVQGLTNEKGEVELELKTLSSKPPRFLRAVAQDSYWDVYLENPELSNDSINTLRLSSLAETISGFPEKPQFGYGQRLMGLDQVPQEKRTGAGVKIAIIDSGCDNSHPLLKHVKLGRDFSGDPDVNGWNKDVIGHGTHCAGIITAYSSDNNFLSGFAPKAEVHILRIFPGGEGGYSKLIDALNYCIENQIDVINLSLGVDAGSNPFVEQKLELATNNGIACIASAGNKIGGKVFYPASSPYTLAVAAVGNLKELQPYTWDSTNVQTEFTADDGIFVPSFSCSGPEVDVCGPGVGIISTYPGGTFKPDTGTSMAAPHITGLSALFLAHHPLFQTQFRERNRDRVQQLFNLIRSQRKIYPFDFTRVGTGLPHVGPLIETTQPLSIGQPFAVPEFTHLNWGIENMGNNYNSGFLH
ncbi:S8 family serine peptidase [Bacillus cereus group sp. MYBK14-1]|uniref:S8 family serine peptidase n=1 Tax=Bacillus cereus group sp. MYBK14-1 TaxID=3450682 RepID=UPI003F794568